MRTRQPSDTEQVTAAVLIGIGVMVVTRLLVVGGMAFFAWLTGILLWSSHVPDELRFQSLWFTSLLASPYHWVVYLICGATAGAISWHYRAPATDKRRRAILWSVTIGLLLLTGWFMMPVEAVMVLAGFLPMYSHGWRVIVQGLPVTMVEPLLAGVALLKMPVWTRALHQPIVNFLRGG